MAHDSKFAIAIVPQGRVHFGVPLADHISWCRAFVHVLGCDLCFLLTKSFSHHRVVCTSDL